MKTAALLNRQVRWPSWYQKYVAEHKISGKNMVSIVCGANMNFDRLRYIAERTELGEQREAIYAVTLSEEKAHS